MSDIEAASHGNTQAGPSTISNESTSTPKHVVGRSLSCSSFDDKEASGPQPGPSSDGSTTPRGGSRDTKPQALLAEETPTDSSSDTDTGPGPDGRGSSAPPEDSNPSSSSSDSKGKGRARSHPLLEKFEKGKGNVPGGRIDLTFQQRRWLSYRPFLEEQGLELPRRYRADYVLPANGSDVDAEDDILSPKHLELMNATRRADGVQVVLKRVEIVRRAHQVGYVQLFNDTRRINDPENHCIRMYDVLRVPDEYRPPDIQSGDVVILVTPFLRKWDDHPLQTVGEAVAMFAQLAEGLRYMHRLNIAYNAKLAKSTLYGPPHIPWRTGPKYHRSRVLHPPKYYLCDFAEAKSYGEIPYDKTEDVGPRPSRAEQKEIMQDLEKHNIEKSAVQPYPFSEDVYNLARFFSDTYVLSHEGFSWMWTLTDEMLVHDRAKRPDMDEVIARFTELRRSVSWRTLRSRLQYRGMPYSWERFGKKIGHAFKCVGWIVCCAQAAPHAHCEQEQREPERKEDV